MDVKAGDQVGRFEIVAPVGEGGMGVVYRARDPRIERDVAIKFLTADGDPEQQRRFAQEARTAGSLSHPNILSIFDVGEHHGSPYIVMELLEGESLRERLGKNPLPLRTACEWGAQIAAGLAAAHDNGIVHRDLKPENLFVTADERIKILDFGLAKPLILPGESTEAPTLPLPMSTAPGMFLGTVGYMAPEQARGEPADERSDLFAFGAVFFEMLTGQRAFHESSAVATLHAILAESPPDPSSVTTGPASEHDRIVRRCLEKKPERRYSSAGDLAFHLELLADGSHSSTPPGGELLADASKRPPALGALVLTALVALVVGAVAHALFTRTQPTPAPLLQPVTFSGGERSPSVSPDGNTLAFVANRDGVPKVWLKSLPGGDEVKLNDLPASDPSFTSDGTAVLFVSDNVLYRAPILGGEPRKVVDDAAFGSESPDGRLVAFVRYEESDTVLFVVRPDGSELRELYRHKRFRLKPPEWTADGRWIVTAEISLGATLEKILRISSDTGHVEEIATLLPSVASGVTFALSGASDMVYAERLSPSFMDSRTGIFLQRLGGRRRRLLARLYGIVSHLDTAADGSLVMELSRLQANLLLIENASRPAERRSRWLTRGDALDRQPELTPDGRSFFFASNRSGNVEIWSFELESGALRRLTDHPGTDYDPFPTADGRHLIWSSDRSGNFEIWMAEADGRNPRQITTDGTDAENATLATADGWLVYNSTDPDLGGVRKTRLDGTGDELLVAAPTMRPRISPDGRHAAFIQQVNRGIHRLRVVRVDDGALEPFTVEVRQTQDTGAPSSRVIWSADGKTIFFLGLDDDDRPAIFAQSFVPTEDTTDSRRVVFKDADGLVPRSFTTNGDVMIVSLTVLRQGIYRLDDLPGVRRPGLR